MTTATCWCPRTYLDRRGEDRRGRRVLPALPYRVPGNRCIAGCEQGASCWPSPSDDCNRARLRFRATDLPAASDLAWSAPRLAETALRASYYRYDEGDLLVAYHLNIAVALAQSRGLIWRLRAWGWCVGSLKLSLALP